MPHSPRARFWFILLWFVKEGRSISHPCKPWSKSLQWRQLLTQLRLEIGTGGIITRLFSPCILLPDPSFVQEPHNLVPKVQFIPIINFCVPSLETFLSAAWTSLPPHCRSILKYSVLAAVSSWQQSGRSNHTKRLLPHEIVRELHAMPLCLEWQESSVLAKNCRVDEIWDAPAVWQCAERGRRVLRPCRNRGSRRRWVVSVGRSLCGSRNGTVAWCCICGRCWERSICGKSKCMYGGIQAVERG